MLSRQSLIGGAAAFVLALIILVPYLNGHWHLADDAAYGIVGTNLLQLRTLREGMWPLWNPNVGLGGPWSLAIGNCLYYPLQTIWGLLIGWTEIKYVWFVWLHLGLAGWLSADFGRRAGLGLAASTFLAITYSANGFVLGFVSNPTLMVPWVFWPLLGSGLLLLRAPAVGDRRRGLRLVALSFFLIEVASYPLLKLTVFASTAAAYWMMARDRTQPLRNQLPWRSLAAAALIAILASSPEWVTTYFEGLPLVDRQVRDIYDESVFHNVANFLQWGTALFPAQFLWRNVSQLASMHLERSWWLGILTPFLLLAASLRGLIPYRRFAAVALVSAVAFLFALGGHSFLRETASFLVPLLGKMRQSHLTRIDLMALLCFLGAVALQAISDADSSARAGDERATPSKAARLAVWGWGAFLALCAGLALSEQDHPFVPRLAFEDATAGLKIEALHALFYLLVAYTAYAFRWGQAAAFGRRRPGIAVTPLWVFALVAVQFASLAETGYAYRHLLAQRSDEKIKEVDEGFVVARPQPNVRSTQPFLQGKDWYNFDGNVKALNGYLPPYHRWLEPAKRDPRTAPLVSTLASCQSGAAIEGAPADLSCANERFQIDYHFGNRIELSGSGSAPALIVVHDFYHPGWRAWVNDVPAPVRPAFEYFKGVVVPAGEWKLRLKYVNPAFPAVWLLVLLGTALFVAVPEILVSPASAPKAKPSRARGARRAPSVR